jgi:hypothetical protein
MVVLLVNYKTTLASATTTASTDNSVSAKNTTTSSPQKSRKNGVFQQKIYSVTEKRGESPIVRQELRILCNK